MSAPMLSAAWVKKVIPRRPRGSQKGLNGHVLIVAGSRGTPGAAALSAVGALYSGAGLVTVGIVEKERKMISPRFPEIMTVPLPETADGALAPSALGVLARFIKDRRIDVLAVGPGLSQRGAVKQIVLSLLKKWKGPMVLDADGLNVSKPKDIPSFARLVITPHPGELSRFIGVSVPRIQNNRIGITTKTARELGIVCVLKGAHTVISDGKRTMINPTGNSAMATGGMGDVLTGVIASLLAQKLPPFEAACAGVYLHGLAGDMAAIGDRGLLATELAANIPRALARIL